MKREDINQLINKYMAGETTPEEENILYESLKDESIPEEWRIVREMIGDYSSKVGEYDQLLAERRMHRNYLRFGWAAAIAALMVVGIGLVIFPNHESPSDPTLAEKQNHNNEMTPNIEDNDSADVNVNNIVLTTKGDRLATCETKLHRKHKKTNIKQVNEKPTEQQTEASEAMVCDYTSEPLTYHDEMALAIRNRGLAVQQEVKSMTVQ